MERGAREDEIREAIRHGTRGREARTPALPNELPLWSRVAGNGVPIKQVAPGIVEEEAEIVVITVYTFCL